MKRQPQYSLATTVWLILLVLLVAAFAALTFAVTTTRYFPFELGIARALQSIQLPGYDTLLKAVGWLGYPPQVYVEVVIIGLLLWFTAGRWQAVVFAVDTILVGAGGLVIKIWINRPRPTPDLIQVANPALDGGRQSYPAGHPVSFLALLGFLMYLLWTQPNRKTWQTLLIVLLGVLIVLIGPSRIYVGEHWFTDVVGAYLLGAILLLLMIRLYEWGKGRFLVPHPQREAEPQAARRNPT